MRNGRRNREEISRWLRQRQWHLFGSFATNDPSITEAALRDKIKHLDAEFARLVAGPRWHRRPEDRPFTFYVFEKLQTNPHAHCLIAFYDPDPERRKEHERRLLREADRIWKKYQPSGSSKMLVVKDQEHICDYVVKGLANELEYREFVVWREFDVRDRL